MEKKFQLTEFLDLLEKVTIKIGHLTSYLTGLLVVIIVVQVFLRYVLGRGMVMLEEFEWHLYSVGLLLGIAYCTATDSQIKMDLLYMRYSERKKAWVELISLVLLVLPFSLLLFLHGVKFTQYSFHLQEMSDAPLGLPYRWVIKSFIPLGMLFLFFAAGTKALKIIFIDLKSKADNGNQ